jgi:sugar O-acyltransferase (sialic acid O-acetyltransferase NeuD family)
VTQKIVVVGAGGFGREIIDVIDAVNDAGPRPCLDLVGVLDDRPSEVNLRRLADRSVEYLGTLDEFLDTDVRPDEERDLGFVIGVGNPSARRQIAHRLEASGLLALTVIHPSVTVGANTTIGGGSVLCAGARLTTNVTVGQHVHINLNATVGHDATIEDYVSVNPLASISGDCVLGQESLIGVAGVVLQGLTVGRGAVVGGAACAVKDVASFTTVVGVPARPLPHRSKDAEAS